MAPNAVRTSGACTSKSTNLAALLEDTLRGRGAGANPNSNLELEIKRLRTEELPLLARDVELLPSEPSIQYRYGLALYVAGKNETAVEHLVKAAELEPETSAYAQAAAMMYESLENWPEALKWGEQAVRTSGGDTQAQLILDRIRSSSQN